MWHQLDKIVAPMQIGSIQDVRNCSRKGSYLGDMASPSVAIQSSDQTHSLDPYLNTDYSLVASMAEHIDEDSENSQLQRHHGLS